MEDELLIQHVVQTTIKQMMNTIEIQHEPITHLVLSGGGICGFYMYGALLKLQEQGVFHMDNIKTIYATSVGAIFAIMMAMKFEWTTYTDYIVKRPWEKVYNVDIYHLMNAYDQCGIFNKKFIQILFEPFFKAKDMELNITLGEFYKQTNIEIHMFVTELNEFKQIDISHTTHQDWEVLDAVYASCCLPIVFRPHITKEKCYIDGCFFSNYPISQCLESIGEKNSHRILGIFIDTQSKQQNVEINEENNTNIFDYLFIIMQKFINHRILMNQKKNIQYHLDLHVIPSTLNIIDELVRDSKLRKKAIEMGETQALEYIKNTFIL